MRARLLLLTVACLAGHSLAAAPQVSAQRPSLRMPVSFAEVQALPRRAPDVELRYGNAPSQRILLWYAAGTARPAPIVALLHGGCWLAEYSVDHVEPLATALAAEGFAVWAPEYRRIGEAGGGWPGTFEDVAAALDRLNDAGDPALDPERVVLVGHSAGGHLALWAAARAAFPASHPMHREAPLVPRAVVALAAITDLVAHTTEQGGCPPVVPRLMGGSPADQPERYRLASPAALPRPVPAVLVHGSADAIVPLSQARALPDTRLRLVEGAGHFDLIHPETAAFAVLVEELRRWID